MRASALRYFCCFASVFACLAIAFSFYVSACICVYLRVSVCFCVRLCLLAFVCCSDALIATSYRYCAPFSLSPFITVSLYRLSFGHSLQCNCTCTCTCSTAIAIHFTPTQPTRTAKTFNTKLDRLHRTTSKSSPKVARGRQQSELSESQNTCTFPLTLTLTLTHIHTQTQTQQNSLEIPEIIGKVRSFIHSFIRSQYQASRIEQVDYLIYY